MGLREPGQGEPAERGLEHTRWATSVTARSAVEARVPVTSRMMRPEAATGGCIRSGLPWHSALTAVSGDAANELSHMSLDPNVHIQEVKAMAWSASISGAPGSPARRGRASEAIREPRAAPRRPRGTYQDSGCAGVPHPQS